MPENGHSASRAPGGGGGAGANGFIRMRPRNRSLCRHFRGYLQNSEEVSDWRLDSGTVRLLCTLLSRRSELYIVERSCYKNSCERTWLCSCACSICGTFFTFVRPLQNQSALRSLTRWEDQQHHMLIRLSPSPLQKQLHDTLMTRKTCLRDAGDVAPSRPYRSCFRKLHVTAHTARKMEYPKWSSTNCCKYESFDPIA